MARTKKKEKDARDDEPGTSPGSEARRLLPLFALGIAAAAVAWITSVLIDRASLREMEARLPPPLELEQGDVPALARALERAHADVTDAIRRGAGPEEIGERAGSLGKIYQANAHGERARTAYRLAMELDPRDARWPYYLAFLGQQRGEAESVTELLEQSIALDPNYPPAWLKLADNQFKRGQEQEARASYQKRLALVPGDPYAHLGLARIAVGSSDWDSVRSHLEAATQTAPYFGAAHRLLARAYEQLGDARSAAAASARAADGDRFFPAPDPLVDDLFDLCFDVDWLLANAYKYAFVRGSDVANRMFNRALDLEPENPKVYLILGQTTQDLDQARRAFETAVSLDPDNPEAYGFLGEALRQLGQLQGAEPVLREAVRLGSAMPMTYENLGLCLAEQSRFEEAIGYLQQAVDMEPEGIDYRLSLAGALARAGRTAEARRHYRKVLAIRPDHEVAKASLSRLGGNR